MFSTRRVQKSALFQLSCYLYEDMINYVKLPIGKLQLFKGMVADGGLVNQDTLDMLICVPGL